MQKRKETPVVLLCRHYYFVASLRTEMKNASFCILKMELNSGMRQTLIYMNMLPIRGDEDARMSFSLCIALLGTMAIATSGRMDMVCMCTEESKMRACVDRRYGFFY